MKRNLVLAMVVAMAGMGTAWAEQTTIVIGGDGKVQVQGTLTITATGNNGQVVVTAVGVPAVRAQSEAEKKALEYLLSIQGKDAKGEAYDTAKFPHADGAWFAEMGPALTAMVVKGLIEGGHKVDEPAVVKALAFIYGTQKEDGGFYTFAVPSYNTSITVSALAALPQTPELKDKIARATKFLRSTQSMEGSTDGEGKKITKDHPWYGGAGYTAGKAGSMPDMSNTSYYLDALVDSGAKADDPAIQAALVFVTRNQARDESNDQPWAKGRGGGGFIYSTANGTGKSEFVEKDREGSQVLLEYGSMTYAGLKSFIYAGLTKDDPKVKAAYKWITGHWTLDKNPGTDKESGLYYYYHTFARALRAYGEDTITDEKGVKHDWRGELVAALTQRQKANGSFVNDDPRWMEKSPVLATAFAVLALEEARK